MPFFYMHISIIDGNALGYACHYGTILKSGEMQTQAVYGFIRTLMEQKERYPETAQVVLWDGRAQWRYDRCPTYKSNRHSDDPAKEALREAYKAQVPYIKRMLSVLGVRQVCCLTHEADDLAGLIVANKKPDQTINLLTSDKDWLQLVRNGVFWYDFRSKKNIGMYNFRNETGFATPESFLEAKCLKGDASDAISGVGGIGEKGCVKFMETYGSVRNFFDGVDQGVFKPKTKALKNLASPEGRAIYQRNYEVMQLLDVKPIDPAKSVKFECKQDRNAFVELCGELAFTSLLADVDGVMKRFN